MTNLIAASVALFGAALLSPAFASGFGTAAGLAPPGAESRHGEAGQQPTAPALDYDYFKKNVQPVFLKRRPGHARCVACHIGATPMNLQPMAKGSSTWTEDETRKNFEAVRKVAVAGNPKSTLLVHPLEEAAGGDFYHSGGKHWTSQSDPEWQLLRVFVMGQTP